MQFLQQKSLIIIISKSGALRENCPIFYEISMTNNVIKGASNVNSKNLLKILNSKGF